MKKIREDIFKKVKVVVDESDLPVTVDGQLFIAQGDIRNGELVIDRAAEASGIKKSNFRIKPCFLVSGKNAKKFRAIK